MCGSLEYQGTKVFFLNPEAKLPVRHRDGAVSWVPWGFRKLAGATSFPNGGWTRLESIKSGKWKQWNPRPVQIVCDRFMEKDETGTSHWFEMAPLMVIQGLLAERNDERLVYVVTEPPPLEYAWIHDRYPRLVKIS